MKPIRHNITLSVAGLGAAALIWSSCVVTVKPAAEPTNEPPPAPAVALTCGPNQYVHGGKHVWQQGKWVWMAPSCRLRPTTWRAGCTWERGRWTRSGNRMVFRSGRLNCPAVAMEPVAEPPPPPAVTMSCAPNQFLRGGKHVWRNGAYVWIAPTCVARPATWRAGCSWMRGRWTRTGNRLVYRAGRLNCPAVVVPPRPVIVHATELPPPPPRTYRAPRCRGNTIAYPGRYTWNGTTRSYTWTPGVCVARPAAYKRCKWVAGSWRHYNGRAYYVRPAWNCRGKVTYWTRTGGAWNPPPTYSTFIKWKACRAGWRHDANGRCFKPVICRAGFVKQGNRCVRAPRVLVCRPGTVKRGNRCVKAPRALVCRPGTVKRGNRCVKAPRVLVCPAGSVKRGNRCVKVARPLACPAGTVKRGNRCVKVARPLTCPAGTVKRGNRCVKVVRPLTCPAGSVKRGNRCVKVARPLVCPAGTVKKGNRCVKVVRRGPPAMRAPAMRAPVKRCPRGQRLVGGRCK